jgi:hypothetical protein
MSGHRTDIAVITSTIMTILDDFIKCSLTIRITSVQFFDRYLHVHGKFVTSKTRAKVSVKEEKCLL